VRPSGFVLCMLLAPLAVAQKPATLDAITFDDQKGVMYLPAHDIKQVLGWPLAKGKDHKTIYLNKKAVRTRVRTLADGSALVSLEELKRRGLALSPSDNGKVVKVRIKKRAFLVRQGEKRVVINKAHLQLRAWQGQRVVMSAPVTLGIEGKDTPSGLFKAQGEREKMHKSKLYHNAPMPWSVHIVGNVYVHGWPKVTSRRGSHGCIRLPIDKARFFYYWADPGTPVSILGKWPRGAKS
jgi:lipoprotein-anchoring transpeptidase ErfK/SrfK